MTEHRSAITHSCIQGLDHRKSSLVREFEILLEAQDIGTRRRNGIHNSETHLIAALFTVATHPTVIVEEPDIPGHHHEFLHIGPGIQAAVASPCRLKQRERP